ncbi:protein DUF642 L-GALACTONO-1,4-LACTONE-RESPONSIVE GENE 1-like [Rhododendron vialii]|uniref:protein DUF642 L-GALACTONO-1,4-LACTONE-RESPONSIVE GENE 1-like n=1 Tax=Rhododendron vialii TaxID=182163 RepID=UPI00265DC20E|nr:protein DUF642 L-GALACTONO-1,4-LACTONE-RESPONSIVE GENE 1-like [Rhododendron vialii]
MTCNLLRNGNFETGPYISPNTSWGVLVPSNIEDAHCPLIGWSVISLKAVKYIDYAHYFMPVGNRAVQLMAGRESIIVQTPDRQDHARQGLRPDLLRLGMLAIPARSLSSSYYHMKSNHSGPLCGPVVDDVKLVVVNAPPKRIAQHKHA